MIFAGISVVVNVSLALTLFNTYGGPGIAIAEISAGWINAALLFVTLLWRGHWPLDLTLITRIPRLMIAAGLMAVAVYFAKDYFSAELETGAPLYEKVYALGVIVAGAMAIYFSLAILIGGVDRSIVKRLIKRRRSA